MNLSRHQHLVNRLRSIVSTSWLPVVLIGLALLFVVVGGAQFYFSQAKSARHAVEANLATITQLKADQIIRWRKERLTEANVLVGSHSWERSAEQYLANPDTEGGNRFVTRLRSLQEHNQYHALLLVDTRGKVRFSITPQPSPSHPDLIRYLAESFQTQLPLITDLYIPAEDPTPHIEVIVPLFSVTGTTAPAPIGAIILCHEAKTELFPIIKFWPSESPSAETVLVRREGDSVLYLSELRRRPSEAGPLRIPVAQETVTAVQAALGREGAVAGTDYRGIRVLANLRRIPHSPWAVEAKIDEVEALADWNLRANLIVMVVLFLVLTLSALAVLIFQSRRRYRALAQSTAALHDANRAYRILSECNQELVQATDEAGLLRAICQHIVAIGGYRMAWVGMAEQDTAKSIRPVAQAGFEDGYLAQLRITWADTARGRGPSGTAIRTGHPMVCQDILTNPEMAPWRDQALQRGYASSLAIPLLDPATGRAFGAVMIYDSEPIGFADEELKLLTELVNDMAVGIQILRLRAEREKVVTALRASESRLRQAVAAGNVGLWDWDLITDQVYYSPEWKQQIGYADHEIENTDREWESRVHPEDLPGLLHQIQVLIDQPRSHLTVEFRFRHKDGSYRWILNQAAIVFDGQGNKRQMFGAHVDITERKRAEDALRESETLLRESQIIAGVGSYALEIPTGNWRSSDLLDEIFGIDKNYDHSIVGWIALIHPEDQPRMVDYYQTEVLGRGQMFNKEYRIRRQHDQAIRWVSGLGKLEIDAQGRPVKMLGTIQDVTDRKLAEEQLWESNRRLDATLTELRQAQHHLVKQEQLRGLGQMATGVAHDFNNALAPIVGFSEFLLKHPEKLADREQVIKWLTNIHTCATDAALVVRRMREFGRQHLGSDTLAPLDLNKLILQTIELTTPCWKDQAQASGCTIHAVTDLQPVPLILGEEFAIRELLTNLIFNAVDALTTGGTLTLGTAVADGFVRLWVSDTGVGMNAATRQRCFEPFFTTKTDAKGSGLGLALVHSIVERHHGMVEIDSEPGRGTTVTIRLPLPAHLPTAVAVAAAIPLERALRVLVVDDEPALCEVVQAWLNIDGHTVVTATNGAGALHELQGGRFDVVITDKAMPNMSGEQLAVTIHQSCPNLPVILMSGFGDIMKAAGDLPPEIGAILSKPVTESTLREVLAKVVPAE